MNNNSIKIKDENGNVQDAKILNIINIDNQDYVLYYIEKDTEKSDLFASRIVIDENGNKSFEDLKDNNEKAKIIQYIQESLKN